MTLQQFINRLNNIKDELKNTEIKVIAENGLLLSPEVKFKLKDQNDIFNMSKDNVECIVITWD